METQLEILLAIMIFFIAMMLFLIAKLLNDLSHEKSLNSMNQAKIQWLRKEIMTLKTKLK